MKTGGCFTKTKIDFKLDLTINYTSCASTKVSSSFSILHCTVMIILYYILSHVFSGRQINLNLNLNLNLTMAGHSCHWLFSLLVSQLQSLDNILSFNNELSTK